MKRSLSRRIFVVKVIPFTRICKHKYLLENKSNPPPWSGITGERLSCDMDLSLLKLVLYIPSNAILHKCRLIDTNPGPDDCSVCNKQIGRNHQAVNCDSCNMCHLNVPQSSQMNTRTINTVLFLFLVVS